MSFNLCDPSNAVYQIGLNFGGQSGFTKWEKCPLKKTRGSAARAALNPNSGISEQFGSMGEIGVKNRSGHLETVNPAHSRHTFSSNKGFDPIDCKNTQSFAKDYLTEMTWPQMRSESFLVIRLAKSTSGGLKG